MKIVINACFGGFGLSSAAAARYAEIKGIKDAPYHGDIERDDPALIQVVEELGKKASDIFANLIVEEIEPGTRYLIDDYDGYEQIKTRDGTIWIIAT